MRGTVAPCRILGLYRDSTGIVEKKMETTTMGLYRDFIRVILGSYWDNAKENGNYYNGVI